MSAPRYASNGSPKAESEPAPRFPIESESSAASDARTLMWIVLFLLALGLCGFALLVGSIALDWRPPPPAKSPARPESSDTVEPRPGSPSGRSPQ